jgi:hypothetical protein
MRDVQGLEGSAGLLKPEKKMGIPAEPVQFCNQQDRACALATEQCLGELGPIRSLAALHFDVFSQQNPSAWDKCRYRRSLPFKPQAGTSLPLCAHS